ncbi:MAG: sodium/solute symporter [Pirellulales bacterium]|nr:sodium/solute symporter [Pirellulales bacterium]
MQLHPLDVITVVLFFVAVIGLAIYKSRREGTSEDYFLASRGLTWPLIGLSIVAANISTEQMVGMAGQGAGSTGLAVSLWALSGSVGIVLIAFTFLPRFLSAGIYTMPEFLEYRYNATARAIMAVMTIVIYVAVLLATVLYSGGLAIRTIFDIGLTPSVWLIGIVAAFYTTWGGLKAIAWADLIQGLMLLIGGGLIFAYGLHAIGGWTQFASQNADRLHMVLPASNATLPWTGVLAGMWAAILYYCGLNQFIVQRNLAAKNLHHGQMGLVLAGAIWMLVPFAIVMPGIISQSLYRDDMAAAADAKNAPLLSDYEARKLSIDGKDLLLLEPDADWQRRFPEQAKEIAAYNDQVRTAANEQHVLPETEQLAGYLSDTAFPLLVRRLIPVGIRGLILASIAGAVISSLASMLNSAATIFTLDLYQRMFHRSASQKLLVWLGRAMTLVFVVAGCTVAPMLENPKFGGAFQYIQQFQGYIWPGVVAAFVIALLLPRAPAAAGIFALVGGPIFYGLFQKYSPLHYLIQVGICFLILCAGMALITAVAPLAEPRRLPKRSDITLQNSRTALVFGTIVILGVIAEVIYFW